MADASLVYVGEMVKAAIESRDFGLPFTIERNYADFDEELQDISPLKVDVVPFRHSAAEMESHKNLSYEIDTDICIRRLFGLPDADPDQRISKESIDRLVKFTEDIHEFLMARRLTQGELAQANWGEARLLWCPNKRHLRRRQFTGLIRVTHQISKAIPQ